MKKSYNPCDDCVYGINRRDGNGDDSMCQICEFKEATIRLELMIKLNEKDILVK